LLSDQRHNTAGTAADGSSDGGKRVAVTIEMMYSHRGIALKQLVTGNGYIF